MRKTWRLQEGSEALVIIHRADLRRDEKGIKDPLSLIAHLDRWLADPFCRRIVLEMYESVCGSAAIDHRRTNNRDLHRYIKPQLEKAFQRGDLVALSLAPPRGIGGIVASPSSPTAATPSPAAVSPRAPIPDMPKPPVLGSLIVTVINDEDDTRLSGITVQIRGPQDASAPSDGFGKAAFLGIATGSYNLSHTSSCFTTASASPIVLPAQTAQAELHIRHVHAVVVIKEIAFSGNNVIEKDTTGNFASPEWVDGRDQADQSPVSYARNKKIAFIAKFKVNTAPCLSESVTVKGTAKFGSVSLEWTGVVTVNPGDAEVSVSLISNNPLGNEVGIFEASDISWQMNPSKRGWVPAGTTRNVLYVTLGDPSDTPNYWTLLDVSCRGAAGQATSSGVVLKAFDALRSRAISRKRDGQGLTYWNPENVCTATNTAQLLAAANGAGQCGSWAEFLIDMYRIHGITTADKILIVHSQSTWTGGTEGFLVKNWIFDHPPASSANAYTHFVPFQSRPGAFLPGQRNNSPPPAFFNHFIIRADGQFWDPSYGAGPFADQEAWEKGAIDGLFRNAIPVGAPPGTILQTGFDKSLNIGSKLLEFWNLSTNTKL